MRGKFLFGTGLLVGYIFGTRAGRKRYEQMKAVAQSVWHTAPVQHSLDAAKEFALSMTGDVAETALDALKKLIRIATTGAERAERVADRVVDDAVDVVTETAAKAASSKAPTKSTRSATATQSQARQARPKQ